VLTLLDLELGLLHKYCIGYGLLLFLKDIQERECLVEGLLHALRKCMVQFPKPRKRKNDRERGIVFSEKNKSAEGKRVKRSFNPICKYDILRKVKFIE
jgi:hypothetical protein